MRIDTCASNSERPIIISASLSSTAHKPLASLYSYESRNRDRRKIATRGASTSSCIQWQSFPGVSGTTGASCTLVDTNAVATAICSILLRRRRRQRRTKAGSSFCRRHRYTRDKIDLRFGTRVTLPLSI